VRSSGRIPKEIPILLIGSDLDGRVFSEPTKTVMLSLHGAGIFSRHKLSAEQELVLRWPERNKESEIRVVGHIGSGSGGHTYGVAFFDPNLNFWEIDFPPLTPQDIEAGFLSLVCTHCKTLERIDDSSIEADVCATNEGVIRFCKRCGISTLWKSALSAMKQEAASPESSQLPLFSPPPNTAPTPPPAPDANAIPIQSPAFSPAPAPAPAAPSFYAQSHRPAQVSSPSHSQATAVLTLPSPDKPAFPRVNRRKHARVKVRYSACVRHPERGDDIVVCEDMSKGGLRFQSHKHYYAQSLIDVAVPYEPGQPAIFVPAQIVFVEELREQQLYRYGVAYLQPTKHRDSF
jgi:hypothetical protein